MLTHPTLEKLESMRLNGMAKALKEQREMDDIQSMNFEKRLGLLLEREAAVRETRRLKTSGCDNPKLITCDNPKVTTPMVSHWSSSQRKNINLFYETSWPLSACSSPRCTL